MAHWGDNGVQPDYRDENPFYQPPDPPPPYPREGPVYFCEECCEERTDLTILELYPLVVIYTVCKHPCQPNRRSR